MINNDEINSEKCQNIACNFRLGENYDSSELLEVLKNGQLDTILVCPHCYDLILNQEFDNEVIVPDDEGFVPHDEDYELDSEGPDPSDYFGLDFDFENYL
ncbi:MAG: hypothetical protein PHS49_08225 [Candidatus Gracilibacteria bacterium]|nr:hypothetical protein [Candidatus Gracilibacteria bacterium]